MVFGLRLDEMKHFSFRIRLNSSPTLADSGELKVPAGHFAYELEDVLVLLHEGQFMTQASPGTTPMSLE